MDFINVTDKILKKVEQEDRALLDNFMEHENDTFDKAVFNKIKDLIDASYREGYRKGRQKVGKLLEKIEGDLGLVVGPYK